MTEELKTTAWNCLPKEFKENVKETYREYTEKISAKTESEYRIIGYIAAQTELELLFGIHNLTSDEEGEGKPKFKIGDKIRIKDKNLSCYGFIGYITKIDKGLIFGTDNKGIDFTAKEDCVEPYTEPGKANCTEKQDNSDHFPNPTKMVDWEQRRYEIAKSAMNGILSNETIEISLNDESYEYYSVPKDIAKMAVQYADTLIKELRKVNKE